MRTILDLSDREFKKSDKEFYEIRQKDLPGIEKAEAIVRQLGLAGLWRGYYKACLIIYHYGKEQSSPSVNAAGEGKTKPKDTGLTGKEAKASSHED